MKKKKVLRPKQVQAVRLLARGETKQYVATRLSVATMTVYRWQRDPIFQSQLEALHASGLEATAKKVHIAGLTAAETLQEYLNDMTQPAETRAKFAIGVLRAYPALQAALAKGIRSRMADFDLEERWDMSLSTFDSNGNPIAEGWGHREPQLLNSDGSVTV
jgi:hypothetical protein